MDSAQPHHHHHLTAQEWDAVVATPEFQALSRAKRAFATPAILISLACYFLFFVAVGWWPEAMMRPVAGELTLGVALALAQFGLTWILLAAYLSRAHAFDDAAERIVRQINEKYG